MSALVHSCLDWLRRTLRWSNSRESWQERAGLALVLAMVLFALTLGRRMAPSSQAVLWGLIVLALALVLRRGWLKLFGPVLFYDLVRTARRSRYFLIRGVYAFLLLLLLSYIWLMWWNVTWRRGGPRASDMTEFAASFFYTFMTVQFVVATVLTPAYTAGAISDEKERKTLEFLLATDLRNREIVLSKLVSRLANLTLLILVGLPILGFLQFLGGVDPGLVLAGFAATALTVLSLACLSIFFSVTVRRSRDAIVLTYLTAIAYLLLSSASLLLLAPWLGWASFPSTAGWQSPVTVEDLVEWLNAGNIGVAIAKLAAGTPTVGAMTVGPGGGRPMDEVLPGALRDYAIFHGVFALVAAVWAVVRLRAVFLAETYGKKQKGSVGVRLHLRPPVGKNPMVWKEVFAEPRLRVHWLVRIIILLLIIVSFIPAGAILVYFFLSGYLRVLDWNTADYDSLREAWRELGRAMTWWVRIVGTLVACLLLLGVAVRAASSIGGERDRQTFDSLLTSPLDSTAILYGKWVGSILSVRWGWLWLGTIASLGLITTGLHPLAVPLLLVAWFIYAAFLATLGLWFSMICRTTLRATVWTLVTTVAVSVGHWLLWGMCCIPVMLFGRGPGPGFGRVMEWAAKFLAFGMTPPVTLSFLAIHGMEFESSGYRVRNEALEMLVCAIIGLAVYAAMTAILWGSASARFRQLTFRTPLRRPDLAARPRPQRPRLPEREPLPPGRPRKPLLISEEARDDHVKPVTDGEPPRPRGAILIEEEWRDEDPKPRPP